MTLVWLCREIYWEQPPTTQVFSMWYGLWCLSHSVVRKERKKFFLLNNVNVNPSPSSQGYTSRAAQVGLGTAWVTYQKISLKLFVPSPDLPAGQKTLNPINGVVNLISI